MAKERLGKQDLEQELSDLIEGGGRPDPDQEPQVTQVCSANSPLINDDYEQELEGGSAIDGDSDSDIVDEDKLPKALGDPVIAPLGAEIEQILNT